ncbi:hypothetical protein AA0616_3042 [Komagataeibacter nataicola NRIC 0616]|nr:hypothetical protein AA0616_3042 [Komagataeibacter nataicola NRIC 0616]
MDIVRGTTLPPKIEVANRVRNEHRIVLPVPCLARSHDEIVGMPDALVLSEADVTCSARAHDDGCPCPVRRTEDGLDRPARPERYSHDTFIDTRIYDIGSGPWGRAIAGISHY